MLTRMLFVVLLLSASAANGQEAGNPAKSAEGKTAGAATPLEAMRRMVLASDGYDPKAVRPLLWTADKVEGEAADVWVASTTGQERLRETVRRRFGDEGVTQLTGRPSPAGAKGAAREAQVEALLKELKVEVSGDSAVLSHPKQSGKDVRLRNTAEGWKVVFTSTLVYARRDELRNFIELNRRWGPAYHATSEEVEQGKYKTVAEIKLALDKRLYPEDAAVIQREADRQGRRAAEQRPPEGR